MKGGVRTRDIEGVDAPSDSTVVGTTPSYIRRSVGVLVSSAGTLSAFHTYLHNFHLIFRCPVYAGYFLLLLLLSLTP